MKIMKTSQKNKPFLLGIVQITDPPPPHTIGVGLSQSPLQIWAMPKRKDVFSWEAIPYSSKYKKRTLAHFLIVWSR